MCTCQDIQRLAQCSVAQEQGSGSCDLLIIAEGRCNQQSRGAVCVQSRTKLALHVGERVEGGIRDVPAPEVRKRLIKVEQPGRVVVARVRVLASHKCCPRASPFTRAPDQFSLCKPRVCVMVAC